MKRQFEEIMNEWTETVLRLNSEAKNIEVIIAITNLGLLGQRLIYEANAVGMDRAVNLIKSDEATCDDIDAVIEGIQQ